MGLANSKRAPPIMQVDYPAFCVRAIGPHHILVAGGGGASKTGVANCIDVFLVAFDLADGSLNDEAAMRLLKVHSIGTASAATMNVDVYPGDWEQGRFLICAGQDGDCRAYETNFCAAACADDAKKLGLGNAPLLGLEARARQPLQTDWHREPYQKVVRVEPNKGAFFVTAGADGHVRVWDAQSGDRVAEHEAHRGDVDDVDVSADGRLVVSVGRDAKSYLWALDAAGGALERLDELRVPLELPTDARFRYCRARFTRLGVKNYVFVGALVPVKRTSGQHHTYLTLSAFNPTSATCRPIVARRAIDEVACAMAVNLEGDLTAVGTLDGSVAVFDTHSLRPLRVVRAAHESFVTGVELLPSSQLYGGSAAVGVELRQRAVALSVGTDRAVRVHFVPRPSSSTFFGGFFKLVFFLTAVYFILWFLGL